MSSKAIITRRRASSSRFVTAERGRHTACSLRAIATRTSRRRWNILCCSTATRPGLHARHCRHHCPRRPFGRPSPAPACGSSMPARVEFEDFGRKLVQALAPRLAERLCASARGAVILAEHILEHMLEPNVCCSSTAVTVHEYLRISGMDN